MTFTFKYDMFQSLLHDKITSVISIQCAIFFFTLLLISYFFNSCILAQPPKCCCTFDICVLHSQQAAEVVLLGFLKCPQKTLFALTTLNSVT